MIYETPEVDEGELHALAQIDDLRRRLRHYVGEPKRWVGSVRRVLAARAIQGSNSIEGYHVSVEDAVAAIEGDEPVEANREDWLAVVGYRRAMTYVLQLARDESFRHSTATIGSLHFMMTDYDLANGPGLWRPAGIWIRNDLTGETVYEGPPAEAVPGLMEELVEQLEADHGTHALVRGAMAHLNLAMIHPFRDGNGRMARCLQTLVLAREGILAPELSSIEEYLGENTQDYYRVLAEVGRGSWHPDHDARPWIRFCLQAHFVQATSVLRRVRESEQVWIDLERLVDDHGLRPRTVVALFEAALGLRIRNSSYRAALVGVDEEISHQTATSDLAKMVDAGLLVKRGAKRGTSYIAGEPLLDLRRTHIAGRQPIDVSRLFDS